MKFRKKGTILLVIFVATCAGYTVLHKVKPGFVKPDNFVEEYVEGVIEAKTGVKLDFTPEEETGGFVQNIDWDRIREIFAFEDDDEPADRQQAG